MKHERILTLCALCTALLFFPARAGAENILVIVEKAFYQYSAAAQQSVNTYVGETRTIGGNNVTVINDYDDASKIYPADKAAYLFDIIQNNYTSIGINGVVLIGDLPYCQFYYSGIMANYVVERYFMDVKSSDGTPHSQIFPQVDQSHFTYKPSIGDDGQLEIWVSRITGWHIDFTANTLIGANGQRLLNKNELIIQYLDRVHARMTLAETVPRRFLCTGAWDENDILRATGLGVLQNSPVNMQGWTMPYKSGPDDGLSDLPCTWQAQLQAGPLGNLNGTGDKQFNCFTYPTIDAFGFEWAGIKEHSSPIIHAFQLDHLHNYSHWFAGTETNLIDNPYKFRTRSFEGMYSDGGHSKTRFFIDAGCSNGSFNEQDCLGLMYGMAGNGLICVAATTPITPNYSGMISALFPADGSVVSFGQAFKQGLGCGATEGSTFTLIGAGTLKAQAYAGYTMPQISLSATVQKTSAEGTNPITGEITLQTSASGGSYNATNTTFRWYDNDQNKTMTLERTGLPFPQKFSFVYNTQTDQLSINNVGFNGPSGGIMIEARQNGFVSGYLKTLRQKLLQSLAPKFIDNVDYSIQSIQFAGSNTINGTLVIDSKAFVGSESDLSYNPDLSSYLWYDANNVLLTTTGKTVSFTFNESTHQLWLGQTPNQVQVTNWFTIQVKQPNYQSGFLADGTEGGASGLMKKLRFHDVGYRISYLHATSPTSITGTLSFSSAVDVGNYNSSLTSYIFYWDVDGTWVPKLTLGSQTSFSFDETTGNLVIGELTTNGKFYIEARQDGYYSEACAGSTDALLEMVTIYSVCYDVSNVQATATDNVYSGTITVNSYATPGNYEKASSTVLWYDANNALKATTAGATVDFLYNASTEALTIGTGTFTGPFSIEVRQDGYVPGRNSGTTHDLMSKLPTIIEASYNVTDVQATNWFTNVVTGTLQIISYGYPGDYDQTTTTCLWYDASNTLQATTGYSTPFTFDGTTLTIGAGHFAGNFSTKVTQRGFQPKTISGSIQNFKDLLKSQADVDQFVHSTSEGGTVSFTQFTPDYAGLTLVIGASTADPNGNQYAVAEGAVYFGRTFADIRTKIVSMSNGTPEAKAGICISTPDATGDKYRMLYFYQMSNGKVKLRVAQKEATPTDVIVAETGYALGSTWLRVTKARDRFVGYLSSNGVTYVKVFDAVWDPRIDWSPAPWFISSVSLAYSSGAVGTATAGSARFGDIKMIRFEYADGLRFTYDNGTSKTRTHVFDSRGDCFSLGNRNEPDPMPRGLTMWNYGTNNGFNFLPDGSVSLAENYELWTGGMDLKNWSGYLIIRNNGTGQILFAVDGRGEYPPALRYSAYDRTFFGGPGFTE
jgi:hypothetical protein